MSTLKTTNLQNASAASPAIVLAADGSATAQLSSVNGGPLAGARNRIINGDMRIDQRNAGAAVTAHNSYPVDRFVMYKDTAGLGLSAQRVTDAPTGFTNSLKVTTTTAATPGATEGNSIAHSIEGFNSADLAFGTASASSITLSFWVKSSLTGTFGGGFTNNGNSRWRAFSYAISAANTWEYKTVTLSGDTSGTWLTDNGLGLRIFFSLGTGSSYAGSTSAWGTSTSVTATGAIGINSTLNATFYITGVQLEPGTVATPFERRSYGQELALCQRYFQAFIGSQYLHSASGGASTTSNVNYFKPFIVEMRATPTFAYSGSFNADGSSYITHSSLSMSYANTLQCRLSGALTGATSGQYYGLTHESTNARLNFTAEL